MRYAFISDKTYEESSDDGDKLARVYDCIKQTESEPVLEWIQKKGQIDAFKPDKIFIDPRLQGLRIPEEITEYPCEKDYTLENWLRNE